MDLEDADYYMQDVTARQIVRWFACVLLLAIAVAVGACAWMGCGM